MESSFSSRFRADIDALIPPSARIGIAVSGGPDSLALLLLAAEVRPSAIEAATVDHALRPESRDEAETVARICERIGVPHAILMADWPEKPESALQERARAMRYRLLGAWARERGLAALATAHHLDDQAETLLMRLARGAGVRGLAGMRAASRTPDQSVPLIRPLLDWSHAELETVCAAAGVSPFRDPSNEDEQFERVRVRRLLAATDWLDAKAVAASAANLADADEALDWVVTREWNRAAAIAGETITYRPADAPPEIRRRIASRAILTLATEGEGDLRGRELDQLLGTLAEGRTGTLRGVLCSGGEEWRFAKAPPRRP
ncbi:MAG TPA: tRNA lysidine(34) synthetase TilS [Sphingomicrobium sp.]|nr:tRNA lysidine(34) synthetase TilS [Sphingomicrobium sp.]